MERKRGPWLGYNLKETGIGLISVKQSPLSRLLRATTALARSGGTWKHIFVGQWCTPPRATVMFSATIELSDVMTYVRIVVVLTPSRGRWAGAGPWQIVHCVAEIDIWRSISEQELRCTVVWRDLSSTGQRHHVNRQRFSDRNAGPVYYRGRRVAKKRSSCWLPADRCGE